MTYYCVDFKAIRDRVTNIAILLLVAYSTRYTLQKSAITGNHSATAGENDEKLAEILQECLFRCCFENLSSAAEQAPAWGVCMVITYSKSKYQSGKVANPARGQLNKENDFFTVRSRPRIWYRETGSAVPIRVSLPILHNQAESGAYLRDSS